MVRVQQAPVYRPYGYPPYSTTATPMDITDTDHTATRYITADRIGIGFGPWFYGGGRFFHGRR